MIYWAQRESEGADNYIARANTDGTGVQAHWLKRSDLAPGGGVFTGLAATEEYVFYRAGESEGDKFWIGRVKADGTEILPHHIELDVPEGPIIESITVAGEHLYIRIAIFGEENKFFIARAKIDGTEVDPEWLELPAGGVHLATDGKHIYFDSAEEFIGRVKVDGTNLESEWLKGERLEGATEVSFNDIAPNGTKVFFLRSQYFEGEEKLLIKLCEADLTSSPTTTVLETFEPPKEFVPEALSADAAHLYCGFLAPKAAHHGIGRHTAGEWDPDWIEVGAEAETYLIRFSEAEVPEEEATNKVLVKAGGGIVEGRRYVKAGGELVPA